MDRHGTTEGTTVFEGCNHDSIIHESRLGDRFAGIGPVRRAASSFKLLLVFPESLRVGSPVSLRRRSEK